MTYSENLKNTRLNENQVKRVLLEHGIKEYWNFFIQSNNKSVWLGSEVLNWLGY